MSVGADDAEEAREAHRYASAALYREAVLVMARSNHRRPDASRVRGDDLADAYMRGLVRLLRFRLEGVKGPVPRQSEIRGFLVGAAVGLGPVEIDERAEADRRLWNVEAPADRAARAEVLGEPTMAGRREDWISFWAGAGLRALDGSGAPPDDAPEEEADARTAGVAFADLLLAPEEAADPPVIVGGGPIEAGDRLAAMGLGSPAAFVQSIVESVARTDGWMDSLGRSRDAVGSIWASGSGFRLSIASWCDLWDASAESSRLIDTAALLALFTPASARVTGGGEVAAAPVPEPEEEAPAPPAERSAAAEERPPGGPPRPLLPADGIRRAPPAVLPAKPSTRRPAEPPRERGAGIVARPLRV